MFACSVQCLLHNCPCASTATVCLHARDFIKNCHTPQGGLHPTALLVLRLDYGLRTHFGSSLSRQCNGLTRVAKVSHSSANGTPGVNIFDILSIMFMRFEK